MYTTQKTFPGIWESNQAVPQFLTFPLQLLISIKIPINQNQRSMTRFLIDGLLVQSL